MKKASNTNQSDMLPEYDFRRGTRGKYARRFAEQTNLVLLEPDVAEAFPTAAEVNQALRSLMAKSAG